MNIFTIMHLICFVASDVGLYNRPTVPHKFNVLDKASKDKIMTGSTSGVTFSSIISQKAMGQAPSIDCPAEQHLFPVLVMMTVSSPWAGLADDTYFFSFLSLLIKVVAYIECILCTKII